MTSTSNLADVVRHYQRSIERHGDDKTRLLHCISKLFNLPIKFEHLQETGIGKTVNALRKYTGEVGIAAKTLVTKWKAMVVAEEEPVETPATSQINIEENSNGRRSSVEDRDQDKGSNSSSSDETSAKHKEERGQESSRNKTNEHKSKSSSSKHHHTSKNHSKTKSDEDRKHKSKHHHHEQRKEEKNNGERKPKESTSAAPTPKVASSSEGSSSKHRHHSKDVSSSSSKNGDHGKKEKSKEEKSHSEYKSPKIKSEKHKSSHAAKSSKRSRSSERNVDESPMSKIPKAQTKSEAASGEDTADGFDSTMGANFDDVLGMLNMPRSNKKSSNKLKSPSKPATSTASTLKRRNTSPSPDTSSSNKITTARKPDLLASTAKLEPLDPSIALELPTISNNYKPMPLNQTVMDVVFNHGGSTNSHKPLPLPRNFNESEALAQGISSKTMRTKIYSGVKTGQILQVPSLFDLCTRVLQKNIDALEYTGGVPFEVLRPVLERATPQQLLNVEEYNPYLMDDSEVLWQQHVQRHCRKEHREEMETWREMFLRCQEEKERKLSILAETIKASQKISEAPVRKTQLAFVDSLVKPPRNVQRKQEQYGTRGKLIATPAARVAALSSVTPNAAKVGDARLRVCGATRDAAQVSAPVRPKKAPLMAKTLQFMRGRHKR